MNKGSLRLSETAERRLLNPQHPEHAATMAQVTLAMLERFEDLSAKIDDMQKTVHEIESRTPTATERQFLTSRLEDGQFNTELVRRARGWAIRVLAAIGFLGAVVSLGDMWHKIKEMAGK